MSARFFSTSVKRLSLRLIRFIFHDEVRLLELFSALNLIAWAKLLLSDPSFLGNQAYRGFDHFEAIIWAYLFGIIALIQLSSLFLKRFYPLEARFVAMAFAAGAWAVIALNFWQSGISTTANLNYTILALSCALSGAWLGWKTTSYQS